MSRVVDGWVWGDGVKETIKVGRKTVHGNWGNPAVPSYNWICDSIDEIDKDDETEWCGMCGYMDIRIIHFMTHPDFTKYQGIEVKGIVAGRYCSPCMRSNGERLDIRDKDIEVKRIERNFKAKKAREAKKAATLLMKGGS